MKLKALSAERGPDGTSFRCEVERADTTGFDITFDVSPRVDFPLDRADAFVLPCVIMAMEQGEDLEIVPPVSTRLFHNAKHSLVTVFGRLLSLPRNIQVQARDLISQPYLNNSAVISGFSGGIDSFVLLRDYYLEASIPEYRITHLLFNDVGSHGSNLDDRHASDRERARTIHAVRLARVQQIADHLQLPLIRVRSNLDQLLEHDFPSTCTARDVSVALLMQPFSSRFLYASGNHYDDIRVAETRDMARADPILLPLCSTESMDCVPVGAQLRRPEKTDIVAQMPLARRALDVCWLPQTDKINCGQCEKCKRTMLTLEILGRLEDFSDVFELEPYFRTRSTYVAEVRSSDNPFHREVVQLASDRGYRLA